MRIFFFLLICFSAISFYESVPKYSVLKSLVSIKSNYNRGTGFVVFSDSKKSYIITNKHVCSQIKNPEQKYDGFVVTWTGNNIPPLSANIEKISPAHDLCLLSVLATNLPKMKISKRDPYSGQQVKTIGNPEGYTNRLLFGKVGGLNESWYGELAVQFSCDIQPGASGSPVLDEKFEVIGVASGGNFEKRNDSVFVNGKYLREFLGDIYGNN